MSDAIDRQAALDALKKWLYDRDDERTPEEVIRDMPSAQVLALIGLVIQDDDDFCSHAERREE